MNAEELLRRYADGERDFEGVDLRRVDLCNANLSGINLRNSYIEESGLIHINLSGANLYQFYMKLHRMKILFRGH
ncbi:pentapeptide repeat-containing protein [Microcoleus anatoxicus]|uniref:Pentapeptide repeat-containing protein n=1 Tax=Microcoleus anatoxicus PTRS2 TaxID=2705321 RepID=A0ABU8Z019_9CYAN|nr:MAG: hypothetical protein EA000_17600 [Oscillatoriales cyanobacterium]